MNNTYLDSLNKIINATTDLEACTQRQLPQNNRMAVQKYLSIIHAQTNLMVQRLINDYFEYRFFQVGKNFIDSQLRDGSNQLDESDNQLEESPDGLNQLAEFNNQLEELPDGLKQLLEYDKNLGGHYSLKYPFISQVIQLDKLFTKDINDQNILAVLAKLKHIKENLQEIVHQETLIASLKASSEACKRIASYQGQDLMRYNPRKYSEMNYPPYIIYEQIAILSKNLSTIPYDLRETKLYLLIPFHEIETLMGQLGRKEFKQTLKRSLSLMLNEFGILAELLDHIINQSLSTDKKQESVNQDFSFPIISTWVGCVSDICQLEKMIHYLAMAIESPILTDSTWSKKEIYAFQRTIVVLGECAKRLTLSSKNQSCLIPWSFFADFRNFFSHFENSAYRKKWQRFLSSPECNLLKGIVINEFPIIQAVCENLLQDLKQSLKAPNNLSITANEVRETSICDKRKFLPHLCEWHQLFFGKIADTTIKQLIATIPSITEDDPERLKENILQVLTKRLSCSRDTFRGWLKNLGLEGKTYKTLDDNYRYIQKKTLPDHEIQRAKDLLNQTVSNGVDKSAIYTRLINFLYDPKELPSRINLNNDLQQLGVAASDFTSWESAYQKLQPVKNSKKSQPPQIMDSHLNLLDKIIKSTDAAIAGFEFFERFYREHGQIFAQDQSITLFWNDKALVAAFEYLLGSFVKPTKSLLGQLEYIKNYQDIANQLIFYRHPLDELADALKYYVQLRNSYFHNKDINLSFGWTWHGNALMLHSAIKAIVNGRLMHQPLRTELNKLKDVVSAQVREIKKQYWVKAASQPILPILLKEHALALKFHRANEQASNNNDLLATTWEPQKNTP